MLANPKFKNMTKDRLKEIKKLRKNDDEHIEVNSSSENEEKTVANPKEIRKTLEQSEVVQQWIEGIFKNLEHVQDYIKKTNDFAFNQKDINEKINSLFQNNNTLATSIKTKLTEMKLDLEKLTGDSAQKRIKEIQSNTLRLRFKDAMMENLKQIENVKNIQKGIIQAQCFAKGIRIQDEELESLLEDGKDIHMFTENILAETAEAKRILADIEERHAHLIKIERMLTDVKNLFVELSILVETQQEIVDRIEYQTSQAADFVGEVDLGQIRRMKSKVLWKKFMCFGIILVIILILVVIIIKL